MSDANLSFAVLHEAARQRFFELWRGLGKEGKLLLVQRHILATLRLLSVDLDGMRGKDGLLRYIIIEDIRNELHTIEAADHLVVVCNPDIGLVHHLTSFLARYRAAHPGAACHLWLVPQVPLMVEHLIRHTLTVPSDKLSLTALDLDCVEVQEGVLSMQQPAAFANVYAAGDLSVLSWMARVLIKLQTSLIGVVPNVQSKGPRAAQVLRLMSSLQAELEADFLHALPSRVHHLLVLDRSVDLVTPLMTQLTYGGLLDEMYGIECSSVRVPFSLGDNAASKTVAQAAELNVSSDKVYEELRDKNFVNVGATLYQRSIEVKQQYEKRKGVHELKELKAFMKSLPELQELHRLVGVHTTLATEMGKTTQGGDFRRRVQVEQLIIQQVNDREVMSHIEDLIDMQEPLPSVLRLLCLYSLVNGGLRTREYDAFRESMMLSYGIPLIMATFHTLQQCGLLMRRGERKDNAYAELRTRYRTWNDKLNEQRPDDIAFAYSGYASLLVRLIERFVQQPQAWKEQEATAGVSSSTTPLLTTTNKATTTYGNSASITGPKTFMVCVLGGVTMAELSALRFVQQKLSQTSEPHHLIVLTTHIGTGTQLMQSLLPT